MNSEYILEVNDLVAAFDTDAGTVRAVDDVSFQVRRGKNLGIVGESGCGKSVTAFSIMRLLPQPMGKILQGSINLNGQDLLSLPWEKMRKIRGNEIGMIFQEPMSALNPVHRIGKQISEVYRLHRPTMGKKEAWEAAIDILKKVGIPSPEIRAGEFPHQLSGGMRQRVVIAIALALKPSLVIADEPTTALDVTIQAQILDLMKSLQAEMNMSIIMITHDLGVIAETCDDVVVMYAGRIAERGSVTQIFNNPQHLYTLGLLQSIPKLENPRKSKLPTIPGLVPSLDKMPVGARFAPRSPSPRAAEYLKSTAFKTERPSLKEVEPGHWVEDCPAVLVNSMEAET